MRKLTLALAIGLLIGATGLFTTTSPVAAAGAQTKVLIVVGQTQSVTAQYRAQADQAYNRFLNYLPAANVTRIYSPSATWPAVQAAAKGVNILVYLGHGNGYPNPYNSSLQPYGNNGLGLDGPVSGRTYYYGEAQMAQLELAPDAIVILNHLCYASGDSEGGRGNPTEAVARTRVDGYASGFLRGGASAVLAEGINDIGYYIDSLFGPSMSIDTMWKTAPMFHNYVIGWTSTRNAPALSQIDPNRDHPASDGDIYYRSLVAKTGLTTSQVINGSAATFTPQSGTYYPVAPTRVIDTRYGQVGPSGPLNSRGAVNYQIAGRGGVPSNAIGITANVTATNEQILGYLYVAPTITGTPSSSTINVKAKDNRANGITVGLSSRGTIAVWYGASANKLTDFIVDVTGYFLPGGGGAGYVAFGPKRVLDTRQQSNGKLVNHHHRVIPVAGVQGLPASGVVAVAGNITVVGPSVKGYVTLGPDPTDSPSSSTINFPAGDVRANNVIVPLNANGTLSAVYIGSGSDTATVDIVLDISGYFTAGGARYYPISPVRLMDSRVPTPSGFTKFVSRTKQHVVITGGTINSNAIAISGNLTVTEQTYAGFAAVGPTIDATTTFSNLNFPTGDNRANGVTVPLAGDGGLDVIYVSGTSRTAHLILDVTGYYMNP